MRRACLAPALLLWRPAACMPGFRALPPARGSNIAIETSSTYSLLDAWRALWDHLGLEEQEESLSPYLVRGQAVAGRGELKLRALGFLAGNEELVGPLLEQLDADARAKVEKLLEQHPRMPDHRKVYLREEGAQAAGQARQALRAAKEALKERCSWLPSWVQQPEVLQAALAQIDNHEAAQRGMEKGQSQEAAVG
ncbi:unnamed protein product, partial [Effrenium voratum]